MPKYEKGTRVGAVMCSDQKKKTIDLLGYGIYEGDEVPESAVCGFAEACKEHGVGNPKIKLDSGKIVWGCECWWGPEDVIKKHVNEARRAGYVVNNVDINKIREEFAKRSE